MSNGNERLRNDLGQFRAPLEPGTIPVLQSHANRVFLLMDQLRDQIGLRRAVAEWEIERLRREIKEREEVLNALRTKMV